MSDNNIIEQQDGQRGTSSDTSVDNKHIQAVTNNFETLKSELNTDKSEQKIERRGGARENAGRPLGSKNTATLHKEKIRRAVEQRVLAHADRLANAQLKLALGNTFVFRIDTEIDDRGNKHKQKPVIVEDVDEIIEALDYYEGDGASPNDDTQYYFISTKEPDGRAIENLFDRTFGRPVQGISIDTTKESEYEQLTDEQLDEQIKLLEGETIHDDKDIQKKLSDSSENE